MLLRDRLAQDALVSEQLDYLGEQHQCVSVIEGRSCELLEVDALVDD
jgi:hypothetical protein